MTADSIFSGITTFAKLPWVQCLGKQKNEAFDVAFIGAPFVRARRDLITGEIAHNESRTLEPPIVPGLDSVQPVYALDRVV